MILEQFLEYYLLLEDLTPTNCRYYIEAPERLLEYMRTYFTKNKIDYIQVTDRKHNYYKLFLRPDKTDKEYLADLRKLSYDLLNREDALIAKEYENSLLLQQEQVLNNYNQKSKKYQNI